MIHRYWSLAMATPRTQQEWSAIIDEAVAALPASYPTYSTPTPGSAEFAQFIDHTLLKPEATGAHIDKLCEEARRHGFKVCENYGSTCANELLEAIILLALFHSRLHRYVSVS